MDQIARFPSLFYKQRLSATGIFMLGGVLLYLLLPETYLFLLIPLALAFLFGAMIRKGEGRKIFLCFALGLALALISVSICDLRILFAKNLVGKEGMAEGYVLKEEGDFYEVSLVSFEEKPTFYRVRCEGDGPKVGSKVRVKLSFVSAYDKFYRNEGVHLQAKAKEDATPSGKSLLFTFVGECREKILYSFGKGETGTFLSAILLGERNDLSQEVKTAFRTTASSHILAISGLHIAQFIGFIFCLSRVFAVDVRFTRAMLYPLTFLLYFLAGAGISVFRASVMTLFAGTAVLLRRRSDSVTALVFSAVLLVFPDPFALENLSFLLSYFSTFALVTVALPLSQEMTERFFFHDLRKNCFTKLLAGICTSFCISSCIFVFLFPLQLLFFEEVQLFSPLYALVLVPLFQPVLILGLFLGILSFLPGVYAFLSPFLLWIPRMYLTLVKLLALGSPPLVSLGNFALPLALFSFVVLIFFFARKRPLSRIFLFYSALFLLLSFCSFFSLP